MTPRLMAERGIEVHVLPATSSIDDVRAVGADGVFFSNGPGDPATADARRRADAAGAGATDAVLRHLLRQPDPRPGARLRHLQAEVRPPRHQPAGAWTAPPARSRSPRTTTASPSTHRSTGDVRHAVRRGRGQPRLPQRRRRRGAAAASTSRRSPCSTTRRPRPVRTTPPTSSTVRRPDDRTGGRRLMPQRTDISSVLVIGSGPIVIGQACEFDYSGTQACRVLRGRGAAGHPGQLQPGHDHDRPGVRRRHLRRADHPGVRREDHRQGAPRRAAADPRRPDRAQRRDRAARERRPREVRRRADRRRRRGDPARRGPRALQGASSRTSAARSPARAICHTMDDCLAAVDDLGYPVVVRPSFTMGGAGSGIAYDEADLRRIAGAGLAGQPDHRGAPRGVDPRLEGVRARADARHARQRRGRLLDREPRPDGRAHRRLDHRRPGADPHRPRVPAHARPRHRHHPRGRRRHRRLQHPVRGQPRRRPHRSSSR